MNKLTQSDLKDFQKAVYKDHGVLLNESELYLAAISLISFFEVLLDYDKNDKKVLKSS